MNSVITGLALFLAVGQTIRLGTSLLGADDSQNHNGGNVGDHLEELIRNTQAADLQTDLQSVTQTEEQAGAHDAGAVPATEDNGSQCDETTAGDDALSVGGGVAGGQICTADTGQRTADDEGHILDADNIDAQSCCSFGHARR